MVDFGTIELDDEQKSFQQDVGALLDQHLVERGQERRRYGEDEMYDVPLAHKLGARGLAMPNWPVEDGGADLDRVTHYLLDYELNRRGFDESNESIWAAVKNHGQPELIAELKPRMAAGDIYFAAGYTEAEGGSDIAAAKTRAERDGDEWIINGAKMFTTGAHIAQYIFLITRTDPDLPKHRGLTMFLVPTDWPGVEIQALKTLGDERTNITYYGDVRLPDKYRLGGVNDGWTVLRGPLDEEHSFAQKIDGLARSAGVWHMRRTPTYYAFNDAIEWARTSVRPDGSHPIDDPIVRARLGRLATDIEVAMCSHGPLGRVAGAELNVRLGAELLDLIGPEALLPYGADGVIAGGDIERAHQFAQPTVTYTGSVEIFRQMIAQHVLGLPRPQFPGSKALVSGRRERGSS
jgi:alkylation response protein AidB-like acyl-CoA dehydrogenase